MKIKAFTGGGIVYIPTENRLNEVTSGGGITPPEATPGKPFELSREVMDLIKEKGLNSDVSVFLGKAKNILTKAYRNGTPKIADILNIQNLANRVSENYKDYEKVNTSLNTENAKGEVATDLRGNIYVIDNEHNKLEVVSQKDYINNKDNYSVLTNGDLLEVRRNNADFAFRTDILGDLSAAVGMETIVEFVNKEIENFGKTIQTGYGEKNSNTSKVKTGLNHLIMADVGGFEQLLEGGPNGIYKISTESTIADTGIKDALDFLISSLPHAYKNRLSAKAAVEGYDPSALLLRMIYMNTDRSEKADFDSTATKEPSGGSGTGGSEKTTKLSYLESLIMGRLPEKSVILNPSAKVVSDQAQIKTIAWRAGQPVDKNYNGLTELFNIRQMKGKVEATKIANTDSVTFGNQILSPEDTKKVVWDGSSELTILMLPFKIIQGKKTPDFDGFEKLNNINKYIKENQPSALEINELIKQNFSQGEITIDKEQKQLTFVPEKMMKFLSLTAIACDDVLDIDKSNEPYLEKLSGSQGSSFKDSYNKVVRFGTEYPTKNMKADKSIGKANSWDILEGNRDFYRGAVYMPIEPGPQLAVLMSGSEQMPVEDYTSVSEKWKLAQDIDALRRNTEREIENGTQKELITTF